MYREESLLCGMSPIRASKPMALSLPARKPASLLTLANASETSS